jgi:hypothetical protein
VEFQFFFVFSLVFLVWSTQSKLDLAGYKSLINLQSLKQADPWISRFACPG